MPNTNTYTSVSIPKPLFNKVKNRLKGTGFTSISSFVTFLLREFVTWSKNDDEGKEISIREKLKKLGYF